MKNILLFTDKCYNKPMFKYVMKGRFIYDTTVQRILYKM